MPRMREASRLKYRVCRMGVLAHRFAPSPASLLRINPPRTLRLCVHPVFLRIWLSSSSLLLCFFVSLRHSSRSLITARSTRGRKTRRRCRGVWYRAKRARRRCRKVLPRCRGVFTRGKIARHRCRKVFPRCPRVFPRCREVFPRCPGVFPRCRRVFPRGKIARHGIYPTLIFEIRVKTTADGCWTLARCSKTCSRPPGAGYRGSSRLAAGESMAPMALKHEISARSG